MAHLVYELMVTNLESVELAKTNIKNIPPLVAQVNQKTVIVHRIVTKSRQRYIIQIMIIYIEKKT